MLVTKLPLTTLVFVHYYRLCTGELVLLDLVNTLAVKAPSVSTVHALRESFKLVLASVLLVLTSRFDVTKLCMLNTVAHVQIHYQ